MSNTLESPNEKIKAHSYLKTVDAVMDRPQESASKDRRRERKKERKWNECRETKRRQTDIAAMTEAAD